jgi:hypothetical protein
MKLTKNSFWKIGTQVKGTYHGQPFTGRLNDWSRPTPCGNHVTFGITLDRNITVYGETRDRIELCPGLEIHELETF